MDVVVSSSITPTFTQLGPYCIGDTPDVLPTTSTNSIVGTWDAAISTAAVGTITYTFTPSGSGCATTATMDVVVSSSITPTFTQLGPYCIGDTPDALPTTSTNSITGTWDAAISTAAAGTITYTFTPTSSGCATAATMDVVVNILPIVTANSSNDTICSGESVVLSGTGALNYSWFNNLGTPQNTNVSPSQSTAYFLQGTDINGCSNSDKIVIIVKSCETLLSIEPVVIIPTVFTPNFDGQNDLFNITGVGITAIHYKIYNRWGELIFETNQINEGWNGRTTSGTEVPEGTYFYIATVTTTDEEESHHGSITLIR
jgi:gliding motility-associated-like protein